MPVAELQAHVYDSLPLPPPPPQPTYSPRWVGAAFDLTMANLVPWLINRYGAKKDFARVDPGTWNDNLRTGWRWDDNSFNANHIDHAVHGGMYFVAGRANGFNFWQSAPLTPIGSALWEYFAENNVPSSNDLVITSLAGIAIGEASFRVSALIIDPSSTGLERAVRELATFLVSPGVGMHRVFRGQVWQTEAAVAGDSGAASGAGKEGFEARIALGARSIGSGTSNPAVAQGVLSILLNYGDPFAAGSWDAFSAFTLRLTAATGQYPMLTELMISGLLGRTRLAGGVGHDAILGAAFDYDVTYFPGFALSGPAIGGVFMSRAGSGAWTTSLRASVRALPLSGISSEMARDSIGRPYDYGSGLGAGIGGALRHRSGASLEARYGYSRLWAQSAAAQSHDVGQFWVGARAPIGAGLAVEAAYARTRQRSTYTGVPAITRTFPEFRLMVSHGLDARGPAVVSR